MLAFLTYLASSCPWYPVRWARQAAAVLLRGQARGGRTGEHGGVCGERGTSPDQQRKAAAYARVRPMRRHSHMQGRQVTRGDPGRRSSQPSSPHPGIPRGRWGGLDESPPCAIPGPGPSSGTRCALLGHTLSCVRSPWLIRSRPPFPASAPHVVSGVPSSARHRIGLCRQSGRRASETHTLLHPVPCFFC